MNLFAQNVINKPLKLFKSYLNDWSISYDILEDNKAGAICIASNEEKSVYKALGFSYNMFDTENAQLVALRGCKEMKKKQILSSCSCEIIIVNNRIIGDE